jgi:hypothetical protein
MPHNTTDDDLDLVAIDRVVNDQRPYPDLTPAERRHAATLLRQNGMTFAAIGARLGTPKGTVFDWLRTRPRQPIQLLPCPSRAAYQRHLAAGEDCPQCRAANAAADARYRRTGTTTAA